MNKATQLEWKLNKEDRNPVDKWGLGALLKRLQEAVAPEGELFQGSAFLDDSREMLHKSRLIEDDVRQSGGKLYVGFQRAEKFEKEIRRYRGLKDSGVEALGFGHGYPREGVPFLEEWVPVREDHDALENQWFLIGPGPNPIAFAGWEVSRSELFGYHGISHPDKIFTGFVSDDTRLVEASVTYLDGIRSRVCNPQGQALADQLDKIRPARVLLVDETEDDGDLETLLPFLFAACRRFESSVTIFDTRAASYLVNYFPLNAKEPHDHILNRTRMRGLGRNRVAGFLSRAESFGLQANAVLPNAVGLTQVGYWAEKVGADLIVLPRSFRRPTLLQRMQGYQLKDLQRSTRIPVLLTDETPATEKVPAALA